MDVRESGGSDALRVELRERSEPRSKVLHAALTAVGADVLGPSRGDADVVVWAIDAKRGLEWLSRTHPSVRVLALVDAPDSVTVNQLLAAGARAVLDRDADPLTIARGALAVGRDYVVLPADCSGAALQALRLRAGGAGYDPR